MALQKVHRVRGDHRAQSRRGPDRFFIANDPPDLVKSRLEQFAGVKGRRASQQFVEQHPQAVDISPRVHVRAG